MPLKGKIPTTVDKRLKALFHGDPGAGKTTAAIQFPKPYLIDTERGAEHDQYTKLLEEKGGALFQSADYTEILEEVKCLLTEKHAYKTLVIDPITTVYNNLLDEAEMKVGNEFGRHYSEANKKMKRLISLIMRLDMNVIMTAHSKNEYGEDMKVIGTIADAYKKLPYLFDLEIMIKKQAKKRMAYVKKTRIEGFGDMECFEFTYNAVAEKYGRRALEKDCEAQILASEAQLKELEKLIDVMKVDELTYQKWLKKCDAATFNEMPRDSIQKCIDHLKKKLEG